MICIKCGQQFTATNRNVICKECKEEYLDTIGACKATSNITIEEMEALLHKNQRELDATQALLDGKTLGEVAEILGRSRQKTSLYFSQKVNRMRLRGGDEEMPRKNAKQAIINDHPVWPETLYRAVFGFDAGENIPAGYSEAIDYIFGTLTPREGKVLSMRCKNELTLEETAKEFGVTRERIRQIEAKALRKLRHPTRARWLINGIAVCQAEDEAAAEEKAAQQAKTLADIEERKQAKIAEINAAAPDETSVDYTVSVEELDFSVRSFNCLWRAGIHTVGDLSQCTETSLRHVRNLGRKSVEEIMNKMESIGLPISEDCTNDNL